MFSAFCIFDKITLPSLSQPQKLQSVSPTGGLSDLSGMLAEKMSFGRHNDVLSRRRNVIGDDAQSRDSGERLSIFNSPKFDTSELQTNYLFGIHMPFGHV